MIPKHSLDHLATLSAGQVSTTGTMGCYDFQLSEASWALSDLRTESLHSCAGIHSSFHFFKNLTLLKQLLKS